MRTRNTSFKAKIKVQGAKYLARHGSDWRPLAAMLLLVALAFGCEGCVGCGPTYGDGDRAGVVIRLSKKGLLIASWEGSMVLSGAGQGLGVSEFEFSTRDEAMAQELEGALKSGLPTVIHYRQWYFAPSSIDSDHVVTSVTPARELQHGVRP